MSDFKLLFDNILKDELLHINKNVTAFVEPQSQASERLYKRYQHSIKSDEIHNHNVARAPLIFSIYSCHLELA